MRPDGSDAKEITTGFYDDREPAWMPDGSGLVFSSDRSNDGQYKIWSYTFANGAYKQLTTGPGAESNPVVSPDGKQIAFVDTVAPSKVYRRPDRPAARRARSAAAACRPGTPNGSGLIYQPTSTSLSSGGKNVVTNEDLFPFPVRLLSNDRFLYTADGKIRIRNADGTT